MAVLPDVSTRAGSTLVPQIITRDGGGRQARGRGATIDRARGATFARSSETAEVTGGLVPASAWYPDLRLFDVAASARWRGAGRGERICAGECHESVNTPPRHRA